MVLDYSKDCAACSTPLTSPPRDGADSMCAYLHTKQGRREFEALLKRNEDTSGTSGATSWASGGTKELEVTSNEVGDG